VLTRVVSALIAIPLLFFVVIANGLLLKFAVMVVVLLGLNEFYNAFHNINIKASKTVGFISIILIFLVTLNSSYTIYIMAWYFLSMILSLSMGLFQKELDIKPPVITILGISYIVFCFYHIVFISVLVDYYKLIWLVFITAWGTDTFAYFSGYFFGRKKLCPSISPKKTVEGALGGIVGSILISAIYMHVFYPQLLLHGVLIGFFGSIIGQIGDLTASLFKRYLGIKDYGKIMPGHGGILDRFDSILFTAPLVYYYIYLFVM